MADQQRFGISEPLSTAAATEADLKASATLKEYLQSRGMYESHAEASRREEVLGKLDRLVKQWVRDASAAKGFAEPFLSEVSAHSFPRADFVHFPAPNLCAALQHAVRPSHTAALPVPQLSLRVFQGLPFPAAAI